MNSNSNPSASPAVNGTLNQNVTDAIDIQQWQMEIDNFIDETAAELNDIARRLDGGPIADFVDQPKSECKGQVSSTDLKIDKNKSRPRTNQVDDRGSESSEDRLASLKQKLANRIEENRESD